MAILITTTSNIEGKRIVRYLGLVTGEASAEVQLVSEKPVTSFADTYHKAIPGVRDNALRGAMQGAEQVGANVGIFPAPHDVVQEEVVDVDEDPHRKQAGRAPEHRVVVGDHRVHQIGQAPEADEAQQQACRIHYCESKIISFK